MGGGVPISGVIGSKKVMDLPSVGNMSSTHSANPLSCSAGLAVIQELESRNLIKETERNIRVSVWFSMGFERVSGGLLQGFGWAWAGFAYFNFEPFRIIFRSFCKVFPAFFSFWGGRGCCDQRFRRHRCHRRRGGPPPPPPAAEKKSRVAFFFRRW